MNARLQRCHGAEGPRAMSREHELEDLDERRAARTSTRWLVSGFLVLRTGVPAIVA